MSSNIGNIKILSCGYCRQLERFVSQKGRWKWVRFPARCYVVPLSDGFLLFDSGYNADANQIMQSWPAWFYKTLIPITIDPAQTAVRQLENLGIPASQIKYIFISHFHADHIGGLRDFSEARFICSQEGYESLKKLSKFHQVCKGFVADFLPKDFEERTIFVTANNAKKTNNLTVYSLENLPSMYAVYLPGHATGQLGLWLKEQNVLLAADAAWRVDNLKKGGYPSSLALGLCENKNQYLETLSKLAACKNTKILFTHEEDSCSTNF